MFLLRTAFLPVLCLALLVTPTLAQSPTSNLELALDYQAEVVRPFDHGIALAQRDDGQLLVLRAWPAVVPTGSGGPTVGPGAPAPTARLWRVSEDGVTPLGDALPAETAALAISLEGAIYGATGETFLLLGTEGRLGGRVELPGEGQALALLVTPEGEALVARRAPEGRAGGEILVTVGSLWRPLAGLSAPGETPVAMALARDADGLLSSHELFVAFDDGAISRVSRVTLAASGGVAALDEVASLGGTAHRVGALAVGPTGRLYGLLAPRDPAVTKGATHGTGLLWTLGDDGRAEVLAAGFDDPRALVVEASGRIVVSDVGRGRLLAITPPGAGEDGDSGDSGDADGGSGGGLVTTPGGAGGPGGQDALPAGTTSQCLGDGFDATDLDPAWTLTELGDADQGSAQLVGGQLELSGDGTVLYHADDNGVFLHRTVEGDFRIEVEVTGLPADDGGGSRKGGLSVRASDAADAPRVMVNYMPEFPDPPGQALQFDYRGTDGVEVELAAPVHGIALPVRLAIDKRGDVYTVYYSTDGGDNWNRPTIGGVGGSVEIAMGETVLAGPVVASYAADTTFTVGFDDLQICQGDTTPPYVPGPPPACDAQRPIDVVYLLDRSDSMSHEIDGVQRFEIAKDAIRALNNVLTLAEGGHRAALVTYRGFRDPQQNLDDAVIVHSGFTTDLDAVDDLLAGLEIVVEPGPAATTPTAIALAETLDLLLADRDPAHRPAVVWLSDGVPNIDGQGRGPVAYDLEEIQAISLRDDSGMFISWGEAAWKGHLNGAALVGDPETYDGEPLANAMFQLEQMADGLADLLIYGIAFHGDGVGFGTFNEDLMAYAGHVSGAPHFVADAAGLIAAIQALAADLHCDNPGTATVGDRVWSDLDGDGAQDGDEPGLAGITVELLDGSGTVVASQLTGGDGGYLFTDLAPGAYLVRVDDDTLPTGFGPTYDFDGIDTPHRVLLDLAAFEDERRVDFGYRYGVVGPPPPGLVCFGDGFSGGALGSLWSSAHLGDADQGSATVAGGRLEVTADGTSLFHDDDNGFFVYQAAEGDFRVEVDVVDVPVDAGGEVRKGGVMVRPSLAADAPRVMVNYVPHFPDPVGQALQFDFRGADGVAHELAAPVHGITLPVRLAIDKRGDLYTVYYSTDGGASWTRPTIGGVGGAVEIAMGDTLRAGVAVASYDASTTLTMAFDDFGLCFPDDEPPFEPPPPPLCDETRALDLVYLLDMSDSMSHEIEGIQRFEIAKQAVRAMNDFLALESLDHRVALVTYRGFQNAAQNLDQAVVVQTEALGGLTSDLGAVDGLLEGLELVADPTTPAATTPTAIALAETLELLLAEHDPARRPAVVWLSDGVPNIDALGRGGPGIYELEEIQAIGLRDSLGDFLSVGQVAFLGDFNGDIQTYDGEPLAGAMHALEQIEIAIPDTLVYGVAFLGSGTGFGTFNEDLLAYAGYVSGTPTFEADAAGLVATIQSLLGELHCGVDPSAVVGDRVWADLDADGVQDVGEGELNGVVVELVDAGGTVVASTTTAGDGEYLFLGVVPGSYTVRLDPSTLPTGSVATYDFDGLGSLHETTVTLDAFEVERRIDFGYRVDPGDTPRPPGLVCYSDDFADGVLDPGWTTIELGDADQGVVEELGGRLRLLGDGTTAWLEDHGVFTSRTVTGDFRVEVEVSELVADTGGQFRKLGLMVRDGSDPRSPRVMVQFVPHYPDPDRPVVQFGYRDTEGADGQLLAEVVYQPAPVKIALERRGNTFTAYYSDNGGGRWLQPTEGGVGGQVDIAMGASVEVGLSLTSYDATVPFSAEVDDFELCQPEDGPPVDPPPVELCEARPVDVVYLLDRSGSMTTDLDGTSRFAASQQALLALNAALTDAGDGSRAALVTINGYGTPALNLSSGVTVHSGLTSNLSAVGSALAALDEADIRVDATTPTALGLRRAVELLDAYGDPSHRPVIVWLTDGVPNIDALGRGPEAYALDAVSALSLDNGAGGFLTWPQVAFLGTYHGELGTYDGEVLANAMAEIDQARTTLDGLRIYGVALQGDGVGLGVFNTDLVDYGGFVTAGGAFTATDGGQLSAALLASLDATQCANTATVGDRVWHDLDGDGVQGAAEPGVVGVTVRLVTATGQLVASAETDGQGIYRFLGVPAGAYSVAVDVATLPSVLDEQTYDLDGLGTPHTAAFSVAEGENLDTVDFGYRTASPIDPPPPTVDCLADDFDDGVLDPVWTLSRIGDADEGGAVETGGGLELMADGTSLWDDDHFVFLHRTVEGDFRAEVDITQLLQDEGGQFRKAGLVVRDGAGIRARRVMVTYVPHFPDPERSVIQFGYRDTEGGVGQLLAEVVPGALPNRLAIERQGDSFAAYYSFNGGDTWIQPTEGGAGGSVSFAMASTVEVGLGASAYATAPTFGARFDDFALCQPNVVPVDPPPEVACDPVQPLDVVVVLDRSGSMTVPFSDGLSRFEAAQQAIVGLFDTLALEADGSRGALVTINGYQSMALNLSSGATVHSGLTADLAALGGVVQGLDGSTIDPMSTTPTPIALRRALGLLVGEHDPTHRPVVILMTDGIPNIDSAGRGPLAYTLEEIQAIDLHDASGNFLSVGEVAFRGNFNPDIGTWDGEPLGNTMAEIQLLKSTFPDLLAYGVALQGDGVGLGTFNEDLLDYTAYFTGGKSFSASHTSALEASLLDLLEDTNCVEPPPAPPAPPTTACTADDFADGALGVEWSTTAIGDADLGGFSEDGGTLEVTSNGSALWNTDEHFFVHRTVEGDFRVEVDIIDLPVDAGGQFRKAGLSVRSPGGDPTAPRVMVQFVPHFPNPERPVLQFGYRDVAGGAGEELAEVVFATLPVRVAIQKQGDVYSVFYSTNGGVSWIQPTGAAGGQVTVAMGETLDVGLAVASYSTSETMTAEFDDFSLCGSGPQVPVVPPPAGFCEPERPLDVVLLLDRSGSMTAPFDPASGATRFEAAQAALVDLVDTLSASADGSRAAFLTFQGYNQVELNLSSALTVHRGLTSNLAAVRTAVAALDGATIDPDATTPTALALHGTLEHLLAAHDPDRLPVIVWVTDGVPNIDSAGRGPLGYEIDIIQSIALADGSGGFRPFNAVAWSGLYDSDLETYDGEPLANAMAEIQLLKDTVPELLIYGVALQGDGVGLGAFSEELLEFAAWYSGGQPFSASDTDTLDQALVDLLADIDCQTP